MDTLQIRNFLMIVECGSITKAADRLGIAQPSLSQQLLRIEDELGVSLFKRTARGVAPTEAGRLFQEHALNILQAMQRAREQLNQREDTPGGVVSFGMPSSISQLLAVPLLVAARERFPEVRLRIRESVWWGALRAWLEQGQVDLALMYDAEIAKHLAVKFIATEPMFLIGALGEFGPVDEHGIATESVERTRLEERPQIQPWVAKGFRRLVDRHTGGETVELKVDIEIDSLTHIRALVATGYGYSILPHAAIGEDLASARLSAARIADLDLHRNVSIVRNPTQKISQASVQIEDLAVEILRQMVEDGRWMADIGDSDDGDDEDITRLP